ncbi:phosphoribosylamine--glycine ligase [Cypionkella sp.]|uniref:phosphoribosylamine--glycine ligase n=1 Tax=Cypionkella sp. TaxID=2811411 RepID=UPI002778F492|nr:phosphoribosylamine--glycine ligase [Cypionkella sp.]
MNILILGSGGREHALAWAVKQNPKTDRLIVAPGNAGIAMLAECADLDPLNTAEVVGFCEDNAIDFVIIGPEAPLAAGVADATRAAGILTFGPSAQAAQLEASKGFTKAICDACGAPTAAYARFDAAEPAKAYIRKMGAPIVVKADGLAAGKGVIVAMTEAEALAAIDDMFGGEFGAAGAEVVIEEFMTGEEASFFVLTDGVNALPIGTAQDHKRVGDGDTGPNTGGMGAYSPAPVLTDAIADRAMREIILPTIAEMARRGTPYQGVLYAGLMIKDGQGRLVEYNARFGDPETQVLMLRLGAQALDLLLACAEGRLDRTQVNWAQDHALTVVMAAKGYPATYQKGSVIKGLDHIAATSQQMVFHAGTAEKDGQICANGGRVLNITARAATLAEARARAYAMIDQLDWPEGFCRSDIGWRAL